MLGRCARGRRDADKRGRDYETNKVGTGGRIRTDTVLPPGDFESPASTISPLRQEAAEIAQQTAQIKLEKLLNLHALPKCLFARIYLLCAALKQSPFSDQNG